MAWNLVTRLSRRCEVWVVTSELNRRAIEAAQQGEPLRDLHFAYVALPKRLELLFRFAGGIQAYAYLWQWRAYFAARRLHRRIGFDAFHHLTYTNDWMASLIGALLPVPYLRGPGGGAHRTPPEFVRRYPVRGRLWEQFRAFGQWILRHDPLFILGQRRARAILVCNHEALNAIPQNWSQKAQLFPVNGVSQEALAPWRPETQYNRGFRVLTAGRLVRLKTFDLAIEAFGKFVERANIAGTANATLVIVGEGPEREKLQTLARELGLEQRVRFEGWRSRAELWAEMRTSHVFLFPSLRDGGGLVVVEAMAAGKPVVCADLGGPGMHVTAETGIKVKPEAPGQFVFDLASALEKLYSDPQLREKMGAAARRRAEGFYSWDVLSKRMLKVYEDALGLATDSNRDRTVIPEA